MPEYDLEHNLLIWIGEELDSAVAEQRPLAVPVHLLLVKLAMLVRSERGDLTESVELSLKIFDRANLYRAFRRMYRDGLLDFVDEAGEPIDIDGDALASRDITREDQELRFVSLTEAGKLRAIELEKA